MNVVGTVNVGSHSMLQGLFPAAAVLCLLVISGCARRGLSDSGQGSIDSSLTGAWLTLTQSGPAPSRRVPQTISAVFIHDDGRFEGAGVEAATGRLRPGTSLPWRVEGRRILWADAERLQITQPNPRTKELEICDGDWEIRGDTLHLMLESDFFGTWTETYARVFPGDSVAAPLAIQAELRMNGKAIPLVAVSSAPPGSVNIMRLDTATHMSVFMEARTEEGKDAQITLRVHGIDGPGTYPVEVDPHSAGVVLVTDPATGVTHGMNRASAGTVTIEELDLETLRCRGRLDVRFETKHLGFPLLSPMHVTGSFDLPVWISTEYDIQRIQVSKSVESKRVLP